MAQPVEIKVPNIGDFQDVQVIEVLVKPGQAIKADQSLITLESDKASMEIPSPTAGVVRELRVKIGDKVSEGSPILLLEPTESAGPAEAPSSAKATEGATEGMTGAKAAESTQESAMAAMAAEASAKSASADPSELQCEVLVLGSGPGGYAAAFRAADLGRRVLLVERYPTLGGVCLNVGCIPSKALLHVAAVMDEAAHFDALGVSFQAPAIDLDKLRRHKDTVVARLVGGVSSMAKMRKVTVLRGSGQFLDAHHLDVELTVGTGRGGSGQHQRVRFEQAIIAAGSEAVRLPFLPEDPRIVDSTGALELRSVPKNLLVVGGGIIGLEMATV